MGHIERGTKNPTIKTLEKLAEALACSASDLLMDVQGEWDSQLTLAPGRKKQS